MKKIFFILSLFLLIPLIVPKVTFADVELDYDGTDTITFINPGFQTNYLSLIIDTTNGGLSSGGPVYCNSVNNICLARNFSPALNSGFRDFPNGVTNVRVEDLNIDGNNVHDVSPSTVVNAPIPSFPYVPPYIHPIPDLSVVEGGTYTNTSGTYFVCNETTSCHVTVDFGDGSGIKTVAADALDGTGQLSKMTSFIISHYYNATGTYTVTLNVTDNEGATASTTTQVTINSVSSNSNTILNYDGGDTITFINPGFHSNYSRLLMDTTNGGQSSSSPTNCDAITNICTARNFSPALNSGFRDFPNGVTGVQIEDTNADGGGRHDIMPVTIITPTPTLAPTSTPTPLPTNTPVPTATPTPVPTYTISGNVYKDTNQNGVKDTNENGFGGVTISLDSGQSTTADTNGDYSFADVPSGSYTETLTTPNGYTVTTTNPVTIPLSTNTVANFGLVQTLTSLNPEKVWVGLGNSNSNGIKFDLKAEVYRNNVLITSGLLNSVDAGGSGFGGANLNTIPFNSFTPVTIPTGTQLSVKIYARNACTGSKPNGKSAELWYNTSAANSQFGATIGNVANPYYLVLTSGLSNSNGTGSSPTGVTVTTKTACDPYQLFGTWSKTL